MPLRKIWCNLLISWFYSYLWVSRTHLHYIAHPQLILSNLSVHLLVRSLRLRSGCQPRTPSDTHTFGASGIRSKRWQIVSTKRYSMSDIQGASVSSPPFLSTAASIFSVKGIQLQKDPGKRSSMYPESGKSRKKVGKHVCRGKHQIVTSQRNREYSFLPARSLSSLFVCYMLVCGHIALVSNMDSFKHQVITA